MKKHTVLFITQRAEIHQQAALASAPPELDVVIRRNPSRAEILALLPQAEFLISERSGQIDAEILSAGKRLRLIQRLGSQTYDIDLAAAKKAGIPVCYSPIATAIAVAEHILMQMLALAKRTREMGYVASQAADWGLPSQKCNENTFAINWSGRKEIRNLYQSVVGIIGFGEIGTELARRLKPFGCRVLYNKRNRLGANAEQDLEIEYAAVDKLLQESNFVCSLLPFSPETEGSINKAFIEKMQPGSCLVHSGASGILNEAEVAQALVENRLYGLATDAYSWEPIRRDNPLLRPACEPEANIILTPHTAVGSIVFSPKGRASDYKNLLRVLNNEPLENRIV